MSKLSWNSSLQTAETKCNTWIFNVTNSSKTNKRRGLRQMLSTRTFSRSTRRWPTSTTSRISSSRGSASWKNLCTLQNSYTANLFNSKMNLEMTWLICISRRRDLRNCISQKLISLKWLRREQCKARLKVTNIKMTVNRKSSSLYRLKKRIVFSPSHKSSTWRRMMSRQPRKLSWNTSCNQLKSNCTIFKMSTTTQKEKSRSYRIHHKLSRSLLSRANKNSKPSSNISILLRCKMMTSSKKCSTLLNLKTKSPKD